MPTPDILYEDNHLIAVNKPCGTLVQGDHTGDKPLLEIVRDYIKTTYDKPGNVFLGLAHRLDRPVSGVVLFAKTSKALERLNAMFRDREIEKTYWAIVKRRPRDDMGTLVHFMKKNQKKNKSFVYHKSIEDTVRAELAYKLLGSSKDYHLLEVYPKTGRHHQIRVQLSEIGSPIRGDLKYGYPRTNPNGSISLHARKLNFIHPVTKKPVEIVANPVPDNLWRYFMDLVQ